MQRLAHFLLAAIASLLLAVAAATTALRAEPAAIYDEAADAGRDIAAAIAEANATQKLALIVFGANWCPDCRGFDRETHSAALAGVLEKNYNLVKVDVGRFNRNLDLAARFGLNVRRGIPCAVIVNPSPELVAVADGRTMDKLRAAGPAAIASYLEAASLKAHPRAAVSP